MLKIPKRADQQLTGATDEEKAAEFVADWTKSGGRDPKMMPDHSLGSDVERARLTKAYQLTLQTAAREKVGADSNDPVRDKAMAVLWEAVPQSLDWHHKAVFVIISILDADAATGSVSRPATHRRRRARRRRPYTPPPPSPSHRPTPN